MSEQFFPIKAVEKTVHASEVSLSKVVINRYLVFRQFAGYSGAAADDASHLLQEGLGLE